MKTLKELLRSKVGRKQPVVFAFGRLNPPTIGHQKLIDKVITMAKRVKGLPVLYVSASQDKNKNPLTAKQKLDYLKKDSHNLWEQKGLYFVIVVHLQIY